MTKAQTERRDVGELGEVLEAGVGNLVAAGETERGDA